MGEVLLDCSGWNYPDTAEKGGWTGVFYPDKDTKSIIHNSLTPQRWTLLFMTDSIHK
jgi:hypothetical protein